MDKVGLFSSTSMPCESLEMVCRQSRKARLRNGEVPLSEVTGYYYSVLSYRDGP